MTVVRNNPHTRDEVKAIERHNERKNTHYSNCDVVLEQSYKNIQFKKCNGTYIEEFDKLLKVGEISTRGLKDNANIIGEMIFDVNSTYFEQNGGYEFANEFYQKAYEFATQQVGNEKYILSAVMHADERNQPLSDELGKDVFHYHLHVVYIPIVQKELKWSKRCKNPELVGKVKEVINQVSHSKKWKSEMENDKIKLSYSKLQDDFNEYMRECGYDVERGEKGSTAEHLSVLEYKTEQQTQKMAEITKKVMEQMFLQQKLNKEIAAKQQILTQRETLENLGKKALLTGEIKLTKEEFADVKSLAETGLTLKLENKELKEKVHKLEGERNYWQNAYTNLKEKFDDVLWELRDLKDRTKPFFQAIKKAPDKVKELLKSVLENEKEGKKEKDAER